MRIPVIAASVILFASMAVAQTPSRDFKSMTAAEALEYCKSLTKGLEPKSPNIDTLKDECWHLFTNIIGSYCAALDRSEEIDAPTVQRFVLSWERSTRKLLAKSRNTKPVSFKATIFAALTGVEACEPQEPVAAEAVCSARDLVLRSTSKSERILITGFSEADRVHTGEGQGPLQVMSALRGGRLLYLFTEAKQPLSGARWSSVERIDQAATEMRSAALDVPRSKWGRITVANGPLKGQWQIDGCQAPADSEKALGLAEILLNKQKDDAALEILRPLASRGNRVAQHYLGVMYLSGRSVPQDYFIAQNYFLVAARQRYAPAMRSLGPLFATGEGVEPDPVHAYKWFELARREVAANPKSYPHWQRGGLGEVQETLGLAITSGQRQAGLELADKWNPDEITNRVAFERVETIRTVSDYNTACQSYSDIRKGSRTIDGLVRAEGAKGKYDLLACLSFIEHSRMRKVCDDRDPLVSEILFYTKILDQPGKTDLMSAQAAVAAALVIGSYCAPDKPLAEGTEQVFQKMRKAYTEQRSL